MRAPVRSIALAAAAGSLAIASPAFAGNAHFVKTSAGLSGYDLSVSFKEAGLANGTTVSITAHADYVAVFGCFNGGGNHPKAANKETINGDSSTSGQFTADRNGNVNGSLLLSAPTVATNGFSCPGGQTEAFISITWSDVSLTDSTSGVTALIPGTFSK